jgi:hypothetical protein
MRPDYWLRSFLTGGRRYQVRESSREFLTDVASREFSHSSVRFQADTSPTPLLTEQRSWDDSYVVINGRRPAVQTFAMLSMLVPNVDALEGHE